MPALGWLLWAGCSGLLWAALGCSGPLWAALELLWTVWAALDCSGLLWGARSCSGLGCSGCCGLVWGARRGYSGLLWAALGCSELWDAQGDFGRFWAALASGKTVLFVRTVKELMFSKVARAKREEYYAQLVQVGEQLRARFPSMVFQILNIEPGNRHKDTATIVNMDWGSTLPPLSNCTELRGFMEETEKPDGSFVTERPDDALQIELLKQKLASALRRGAVVF